MLVPATSTAPLDGLSRPPSRLRSVVLPDPDGPIRARNSPGGISRFTPFSTSIRSLPRVKYLWTPLTRTSALMSDQLPRLTVIRVPSPSDSGGAITTRSPADSPAATSNRSPSVPPVWMARRSTASPRTTKT